jgi:hypothetical protein
MLKLCNWQRGGILTFERNTMRHRIAWIGIWMGAAIGAHAQSGPPRGNDTVPQWEIALDPATVRPGPQVVYQRDDLHVGAFHVDRDGVWVLVYERPQLWHRDTDAGAQVFRGARLHLLDTLFNEKLTVPLPGAARALHHDHQERPLAEGEHEAWSATAIGDRIHLGVIGRDHLHNEVLPWTDSIPGSLLGSNLTATYPAFDHIAYMPATKRSEVICSVVDEHRHELFRSQYKYMSGRDKVIAMDLALRWGTDAETVAGYMTAFHKDIYYEVPYAPLFVVRDTLCVFDRYAGAIRRFDTDLNALPDVPLAKERYRERWKRLLLDPVSDRVYALYRQGPRTVLRPIDVNTGRLGDAFSLTHPFPEEVQVHDGYAYYVYRVSGSLQRRTLYREALR